MRHLNLPAGTEPASGRARTWTQAFHVSWNRLLTHLHEGCSWCLCLPAEKPAPSNTQWVEPASSGAVLPAACGFCDSQPPILTHFLSLLCFVTHQPYSSQPSTPSVLCLYLLYGNWAAGLLSPLCALCPALRYRFGTAPPPTTVTNDSLLCPQASLWKKNQKKKGGGA